MARERRELPWERVDKSYVFAGADGPVTLAELFAGRSQLIVYHFMFGPEWREGCPRCSMVADHLAASRVHLAQRDVTLAVVSRARPEQIAEFQQRMGWPFRWVSSFGNDFNRDYHVSFTPEEMAQGTMEYNYGNQGFPADEAHGVSVFLRTPGNSGGEIFHTYSAYARGAEELLGVYSYLDLTPKGRDEADLPFPMAWIKHHDRYEGEAPKPMPRQPRPRGAARRRRRRESSVLPRGVGLPAAAESRRLRLRALRRGPHPAAEMSRLPRGLSRGGRRNRGHVHHGEPSANGSPGAQPRGPVLRRGTICGPLDPGSLPHLQHLPLDRLSISLHPPWQVAKGHEMKNARVT
jgi:predicted dithiol-disulfide oxidoreductase (DUF899 family)